MPYDDEISPFGELPEPSAELNRLTRVVIGAAIEVHKELGPGLPEEIYHRAMELELGLRGVPFETEKAVDIFYKGKFVGRGKIDLFIGGLLVVELKAVDALAPTHRLQVRTYLRMINQPLGLILNFNVPVLKDGIRRVINSM
jgi:GxxExxY protein